MIKRISQYVFPTDKDDESDETSSMEEGNENEEKVLTTRIEAKQPLAKAKQEKIIIKENSEDSKEKFINKKTERDVILNQKIKILYNCEVCAKRLNTNLELNQHLNSKSHTKMLKKNTKNELISAGSLRNFLIEKGFITSRKNNYNKLKTFLYFNSLNKMINN